MKVAVLPTHRILNGDVEVPETASAEHLDLAPDPRLNASKSHAKPTGLGDPAHRPLHVRRTPGISCEAVRTDAKRRNARIGASACHRADTSFVSFIPLFDRAFFWQ
jgi:hypothetical protein